MGVVVIIVDVVIGGIVWWVVGVFILIGILLIVFVFGIGNVVC